MKLTAIRPPKAWRANWICGTIGAYLFTDSWPHFFGLVLILESIFVSLEAMWPASQFPQREVEK